VQPGPPQHGSPCSQAHSSQIQQQGGHCHRAAVQPCAPGLFQDGGDRVDKKVVRARAVLMQGMAGDGTVVDEHVDPTMQVPGDMPWVLGGTQAEAEAEAGAARTHNGAMSVQLLVLLVRIHYRWGASETMRHGVICAAIVGRSWLTGVVARRGEGAQCADTSGNCLNVASGLIHGIRWGV
jgi:hypothetical protein